MTDFHAKPFALLALSAFSLSACASLGIETPKFVTKALPDSAADAPIPAPEAKVELASAKPIQTEDSYYRTGAAQLDAALAQRATKGRAKNIILMIGDGMGMSTVTAGRIFSGQAKGLDGESYILEMEKLPYTALSRTYAHDAQVSDSASTVTALTTGAKTSIRTIGVDQTVPYGDCAASKGHELTSLFELAEDAGRATGVVSTARITHATPSGVYGHVANRGWENDSVMDQETKDADCIDLARQLVEWPHGDGLEIALGGGRRNFLPKDVIDPEYGDQTGARSDGRNLTETWSANPDHHWIWNEEQFNAIDFGGPAKVLGTFEPSRMQFDGDRKNDGAGEPSLAAMTRAAITRLSQDEDGFVLMVEGGLIDMANHGNNAARALEDVMAFDAAVKTAREMTDPVETLIIVTADHSHGLTINGYPKRNNPILGLTTSLDGKPMKGADGKAYSTLLYSTGPGSMFATPDQYRTIVPGKYSLSSDAKKDAAKRVSRPDPEASDTHDHDYVQQALIPSRYSMHTGEDVPVFAEGPSAWLVHGAIEENTLFHIMAYAGGLAGYRPDE
jgi:alkaline phosphatase